MSRSCQRLMLGIGELDMMFIRHPGVVSYLRDLHNLLKIDLTMNDNVFDVERC